MSLAQEFVVGGFTWIPRVNVGLWRSAAGYYEYASVSETASSSPSGERSGEGAKLSDRIE
jgi:hypothetical protein